MLDGLTVVPLTTEEDGVGAGRGTESELVEGEALAACSSDTLASGSRETESSDGELGHLGETLVIKDGADSHDGLDIVGVGVAGLFDDSGDGYGRAVDLEGTFNDRARWEAVLTLLMNSLLRITRLKRDSVLLARKRYN